MTAARVLKFRAWSGDLDDLEALASCIDRQVRPEAERLRDQLATASTEAGVTVSHPDSWKAEEALKNADVVAAVEFVDDGIFRSETGSIQEVLLAAKGCQIDKFALESRIGWPVTKSLAVKLINRPRDSSGIQCEVLGDDPEWVRAALGNVVAQVKKGVPSWSRFRHIGFTLTFTAVVLPLVIVWLASASLTRWPLWLLVWIPMLLLNGLNVARWALPGFELREPGKMSVPAKWMSWLAIIYGFAWAILGVALTA